METLKEFASLLSKNNLRLLAGMLIGVVVVQSVAAVQFIVVFNHFSPEFLIIPTVVGAVGGFLISLGRLVIRQRERQLREQISEVKLINKSLEKARVEAEHASHVKSQFLAHMSHELRTPLNAIMGFSQMMTAEAVGKLNDQYRGYAHDIQYSAEHLLEVINDILDISKIEANEFVLEMKEADIYEPIVGALKIIQPKADEKNIKISQSPMQSGCNLMCDVRIVRQVVLNILTNAVKFTPSGGEVQVKLVNGAEHSLELHVTDTGVGISPQNIEKVVEPFGQARDDSMHTHEGTGLGLSISKRMMELHGGKLVIESTVGKGTTVMVKFPSDLRAH